MGIGAMSRLSGALLHGPLSSTSLPPVRRGAASQRAHAQRRRQLKGAEVEGVLIREFQRRHRRQHRQHCICCGAHLGPEQERLRSNNRRRHQRVGQLHRCRACWRHRKDQMRTNTRQFGDTHSPGLSRQAGAGCSAAAGPRRRAAETSPRSWSAARSDKGMRCYSVHLVHEANQQARNEYREAHTCRDAGFLRRRDCWVACLPPR